MRGAVTFTGRVSAIRNRPVLTDLLKSGPRRAKTRRVGGFFAPGTDYFCGDGAYRYRSLIEERPSWSIFEMDFYLAATIAELAAMPNSGPLAPLYVRKTDAEIALESTRSPNT
jgi:hypothetical protein